LSLHVSFVFGDLKKTFRLWALAKERNPAATGLLKQVLTDYIPYEQGISPILGDCKQLSSTHNIGLLVSDGRLLFVFLPRGFVAYKLSSKSGKVREFGGSARLVLRSSYPHSRPGYGLIITSEPAEIEFQDVRETIMRSRSSGESTAQELMRRLPIGGPVGFLSMESSEQLGQRNLTLAHVKSDRGQVRELNEDCGVVANVSYASEGVSSRFVMTGVADGVGGLASGEIASKIGISTGIGESMYQVMTGEGNNYSQAFGSAFDSANQKIVNIESYSKKSMGSTLSMTLVAGGVVYTASAGDTRTYLTRFRDSSVKRLTTDHRLEQEGAPSHIITRALGARDNTPEVSGPSNLQAGDVLVTCSDGLHDLVSDAEIAEASMRWGNPKLTCSKLIALANSRGGKDNITVATLTWLARITSSSG
jgi:serine/threonine protein phosphatase PrpC